MSGPGEDDDTVVDGKKLQVETTGKTVVDASLRAVLEAEPTRIGGGQPLDEVGVQTAPVAFDQRLGAEQAPTRIEVPRVAAVHKSSAAKAPLVDDEATIRQRPPALSPPPMRVPLQARPPVTYTSDALRAVRQVHPLVVLGVVMGVLLLLLLGVNALRDKPAGPQNPDEPGAFRRLFSW